VILRAVLPAGDLTVKTRRLKDDPSGNGWRKVLRYTDAKVSQSTVARHYPVWRREQGIPDRCDNEQCRFHTEPLEWNGKSLRPILDHRDGNRSDNSPSNLRYLCPACDSQLQTRGGANRGRVTERTSDGYTLNNRDGSKVVAATLRSHGASSVHGVGAVKDPEVDKSEA
jgi:HNH endonuclease